MTLDEAIKHAEEVAEEQERSAGFFYDKESASYKKKCIKSENRQLAEWLKELKQLREQTRWIPVSERLPEVMDGSNGECSDDVLICVADDEHITISTGFYGYYPKSISNQGWWSMWAYGCHQLDSKYKVIAWQPLPKPYEVKDENRL